MKKVCVCLEIVYGTIAMMFTFMSFSCCRDCPTNYDYDVPEFWTTCLDPFSQSDTLGIVKDILWDGSKFLAINEDDKILVSTDGVDWHVVYSSTYHLNDVEILNETYFVLRSGSILISSDGYHWHEIMLDEYHDKFRKIVANDSLFVMIGDTILLVSENGINWSQSVPIMPEYGYEKNTDIILADTMFILTKGNFILTSGNGIDWQIADSSMGGLTSVGYFEPYLIVVGEGFNNAYISHDRSTWQPIQFGSRYLENPKIKIFANNIFVYSTKPDSWYYLPYLPFSLYASHNAFNWFASSDNFGSFNRPQMEYYNNRNIVINGEGYYLSSNGIDWTKHVFGFDEPCLISSGSKLLAIDNGRVFRFKEDDSWELIRKGMWADHINSITGSADIYIGVGDAGVIWKSTDGITWEFLIHGSLKNLHAVSYSHSRNIFVAVGDSGLILVSQNGVDWLNVNSNTNEDLYDVDNSVAGFLAAGSNGTILHSSNGFFWDVQHINTNSTIYRITYTVGDSIFFAVGSNSLIAYSYDYRNWYIYYPSVHVTFRDFECIRYKLDSTTYEYRYIAAGDDGLWCSRDLHDWSFCLGSYHGLPQVELCGSNNELVAIGYDTFISHDGHNWHYVKTPWVGYVTSLAYINNRLIACSNTGKILIKEY